MNESPGFSATRGVADGHVDCVGGGGSGFSNDSGGQLSLQPAATDHQPGLRAGRGIADQSPGFYRPRDGLSHKAGPAPGRMPSTGREAVGVPPGQAGHLGLPRYARQFVICALTGVDDEFLLDGGSASIPPGDRCDLGRNHSSRQSFLF